MPLVKCEMCKISLEADKNRAACDHGEFQIEGQVTRIEDETFEVVTGFQLDVAVRCCECNTRFKFKGLSVGIDLHGAAMSIDGVEGRFAIEPVD